MTVPENGWRGLTVNVSLSLSLSISKPIFSLSKTPPTDLYPFLSISKTLSNPNPPSSRKSYGGRHVYRETRFLPPPPYLTAVSRIFFPLSFPSPSLLLPVSEDIHFKSIRPGENPTDFFLAIPDLRRILTSVLADCDVRWEIRDLILLMWIDEKIPPFRSFCS